MAASSSVILSTSQLPTILQLMLNDKESRSHMLFLGPPGSGKTTAAQSFASALHGKQTNRFASCLFLNSSDERSLETMRQKIYPFVESRMQSLFFNEGEAPPKVIIFDEAETLTDQAQCALRPLLQRHCSDVIIIFICNSLSHIHPQILNKFLILPFAPTKTNALQTILGQPIPSLDSQFRRGDIRFFKQCGSQSTQITTTIFHLLHVKNSDELWNVVTQPGSPLRERMTWFLLFNLSIQDIELEEICLWSALTASETQPYLNEESLKELLWKVWSMRMIRLLKATKS